MRLNVKRLGALTLLTCLVPGVASATSLFGTLQSLFKQQNTEQQKLLSDAYNNIEQCLAKRSGNSKTGRGIDAQVNALEVTGCILLSSDKRKLQQLALVAQSVAQCLRDEIADDGRVTGRDLVACLKGAKEEVGSGNNGNNGKDGVETLVDAAEKARRLMGTAVDTAVLAGGEPEYLAILESEFNYITPENVGKWGELQPNSPDEWEFDEHDYLVSYAQANDKRYKGHTLVWHSQAPEFINDSLTADELQDRIADHISITMGRYAGEFHAWDVVNEAIEDDGSFRNSVFYRKLGDSYIADAFHLANSIDRKAKLYYNDYNIAGIDAKSDAVYQLMKDLKAARVPVDGVGFQMHLEASSAPSYEEIVANFQRFAALGLDINISELDVRIGNLPWDFASKLAIQQQVYHRVVSACVAVSACESVTTWGFTDKFSWIDGTYGPDDPLQYNELYAKKPAYFGLADGFMGIAPDGLGTMPNLVANGHFETGLTGWQNWGGTAARLLKKAYDGEAAMTVTDRTETWNGAAYPVTHVVQGGQTYHASAQVSIDNVNQAQVVLGLRYRCEGGDETYVDMATNVVRKKKWAQLQGSVTLPECAVEDAVLYVNGPAARVDLDVDAVSLRPQTLVPDATGLGPNIITNSDFESDTFGWYGFGDATIVASTAQANSGSKSGYVSNRLQSWQGPATSLFLDAEAGAQYQMLAWVRLESGTAPINATLQVSCPAGEEYITVATTNATASGWSVVSGTFTVPQCDFSGLNLYFEGPAAGVNFFLDDVYVREIPSDDVDGNLMPNWSFESGVNGWVGWGGSVIASSSAHAHSGTRSALLSNRSGDWQGPVFNLLPLVIAGETYDIGAWGRIEGVDYDNLRITVKTVCNGTSENYHQLDMVTATSTEWTELQGSITLPQCALTEASLYFDGAQPGVNIYLDDVVVLGAANTGTNNLVTNPDFEAGLNGWSTWGGSLATSGDAHSGSFSALHSGRSGNWQGPVYNLLSAVQAGGTYDFSAWGKLGGASADSMNITVKTNCSESGETYHQVASQVVYDDEWSELSGTLTLPTCSLTEVSLYFDGPAQDANIYLDDVTVTAAQ